MKHIRAINTKAARIEEFARSERGTGDGGSRGVTGEDDVVALESRGPPRGLTSPWAALSFSLPGGR